MKQFASKEKQKLLDKDALLRKEELEIVQVDLGKDEYVFVRQMTGRERDIWEHSMYSFIDDENSKRGVRMERHLDDFRAKLCVCTICDEKGNLLLEPKDVPALSQNMSAARLEKIVNEAQKLNAITEEDKEALIKNLDAG